ncbi:MAG: hypothetical protein AAGJ83_05180, partial [Planctomycetota bacterium]
WHALGIVLAEAHLTPAAVQTIWEHSQQEGDFVVRLKKNLRRSRRGPFRRFALDLLQMAEQGETDQTVIGSWAGYPGKHRVSLSWWVAAAAVLASFALGSWFYVERNAWSKQAETSDSEIASLKQEIESSSQRMTALESRLAAQDRKSPAEPSLTTPAPVLEDRTRALWKETASGRSLEDALERSAPIESLSRNRVALLRITELEGQRQWRRVDSVFRRHVQRFVDAPWDDSLFISVKERAESLGEAYALWSKWSTSRRTIDEIKTQQQLLPGGAVKDLLGGWLGDVLDTHEFDLVFIRTAKPDDDADWTSYRVGFETESASGESGWEWTTAPDSNEEVSLAVESFDAGQALSVWLVRDSSIPLWDKTILEHTLESPLLVWRLSRGIRLTNEALGYAVTVTTNRRVGPPAILESGNRSPKGTPAGLTLPVDERDELDPKDLLPLSTETEG